MKRFFVLIMVIIATMSLSSCGSKGSPSTSPANVKAVAGDTSVTISWDMQPNVEYWVWRTAGTFIDIQNCNSSCVTAIKVSSPTVITGLVNGTTYAFSINGRSNGGAGGVGSPSISATPRLAGGVDYSGNSTWSPPGTALGTQDLHAVAYGTPSVNTVTSGQISLGSDGIFVAAGNNGSLFSGVISSIDGSISWTQSNYITSANLNALTFNSGRYLAVGDGGAILLSPDGSAWTQENSGTQNDLYAVSNYGTGFIAIGAKGTIITSSDGVSWTTISLVTTNTLYGITYGNGRYVAVGAAGTLITSTDGINWQTGQTSSLLPDLKGVVYGIPQLDYVSTPNNLYTALTLPAPTFVAIGTGGTLLTSPDGLTWTTQNPIQSNFPLNAVTYGHQFVAVGDSGSIFTSIDGITWLPAQNSASSLPNLYAVIPALYTGGQYANQFVYSAVGANGTHLLAQ